MRRSASTIMLPSGSSPITRAETVAVTLEPAEVAPCPFRVFEDVMPRSGFAGFDCHPGRLVTAEFAEKVRELFTAPVEEAAVVSDTRRVTTSPTRRAL